LFVFLILFPFWSVPVPFEFQVLILFHSWSIPILLLFLFLSRLLFPFLSLHAIGGEHAGAGALKVLADRVVPLVRVGERRMSRGVKRWLLGGGHHGRRREEGGKAREEAEGEEEEEHVRRTVLGVLDSQRLDLVAA
jgi:hypothetical protein